MIDQFMTPTFEAMQASDVSLEAAETYVQAAQRCLDGDRAAGLAALDDIFRCGSAPAPDGHHRGELVALDVAPGLTPIPTAPSSSRPASAPRARTPATTSCGSITTWRPTRA